MANIKRLGSRTIFAKYHAKLKVMIAWLWRMRHGSRTRTENTNTNGVTRKRFRCETRPRETTEKEEREVRKVAPVLIRDMDALMRERTVFVIIKIRVRFFSKYKYVR